MDEFREEAVRQILTCKVVEKGIRLCYNNQYGFCPFKNTYSDFLKLMIVESDCDIRDTDDNLKTKGVIIYDQNI